MICYYIMRSCNSFYFYIKPQRKVQISVYSMRCNSFYFYIKPQHNRIYADRFVVVIHSISTSNHNIDSVESFDICCNSFYFYIKPQLYY